MSASTSSPDQFAFLRLYAEHQGALQSFVRSLLSSREEAAEVMQEVMPEVLVVMWQKFDQVEGFRPWAFGVARNMVLRHLRARKQGRHVYDKELGASTRR